MTTHTSPVRATPLDVDTFRAAGHRLVDRLADLLADIDHRALFPPRVEPAELHALFDEPVPDEGRPLDGLIDDLEQRLLPYCTHVNHPGYFGLITPSPLPAGVLADFVASALNQNPGAWSIGPAAVAMEQRVIRWLTDLVGYDATAGGHLTSGGMMANFTALKLARDWASGDRTQYEGVRERATVYTSDERHISVDKSVDCAGIGRDNLRVIASDEDYRLDLAALERAIAQDRRTGARPACLVAMGGSTNNGAVDDLPALRAIADRERMWLHVDAAYGGGLLLSDAHRAALRGIELADSVTIDPHKWFFAPLDAGAILVRDASRLTRSFGLQPAYLTDQLDPMQERFNFYVHSFEQSRRFRGLKVWMGLRHTGAAQVAAWIDANVAHARRLYELASAHPDFLPATWPTMSAICIRYAPAGHPPDALDALHPVVARRIEAGGDYWISTTELKGRTWFRICPVNFRTRPEHIEGLFETLVRECRLATDAPPRRAPAPAG
ncbi:MAG TPA: aminotransferase class I/II-fold pyridoxal phosphate-dependent enzyme [Gemmatimonadaceae bacterium]|nr:aminotransferase class I/II-fold pyridoxal phosphate-dependent enzyme [Gemmatimonadaceae bacterium]